VGNVDDLIQIQVVATRAACERITGPGLERLAHSVDRACCLPSRPRWDRKARAHTELLRLLASIGGRPRTAVPLDAIEELMRTVGPAASGMTTSSRRRLLARIGAGDADGAAQEMENHLRVLHHMARLARGPAERTAA
jgi:DNA-binding GntR family transcriptional regulator